MLPSATVLQAFSFEVISLFSLKTSVTLFALASDIVIITTVNESIISDISMLITYENSDVSAPVVKLPEVIWLAPNHESAIIQAYTVSIIRGLLSTILDSAFTKSL